MAISITIPTTPAQDDVLARALILVNDQTGSKFESVDEALKSMVVSQLKGWADMVREREGPLLEVAYRNADPAVKAQIRSLLGL